MESVERRMMLAADVVISEFMAANTDTLADRDGDFSDWIEILNRGDAPADLSGWHLTDDPANLTHWAFPSGISLDPGEYLIVFASEKPEVPGSTELHANFRMDKAGEYLAIVRSDGLTIEHEYTAPYAEQSEDVSYGLAKPDSPEDELAYFETPTPGQPNPSTMPTTTLAPTFSQPSQTFSGSLTVALTTTSPTAQIRYTTNRSTPDAQSTLYTGPLTLSANTILRARVFEPGKNPGPIVTRTYIAMAANVQSFESNLPVIVLDTFGQSLNDRFLTAVGAYVIDTNPLDGRARMTDLPQYASMSGLRLRGQSSQGFPKRPYAFETWNEDRQDLSVPLLGMPAESDWVLYNPYSEKSLMQNHLAYTWARKQGQYASRTRFIEVFVNTSGSGGTLDYGDYAGVYILEEKIKIDADRVDIAKLGPNDNSGLDVTGGYIFKIDKTDSGESYWQTNRGQRFLYAEPEAHELTQAQKSYLLGYLNQFESALYGPNYRDPLLGYQAYIDVDSWIDHHIMVEMAKNIDGFRISTYFSKDRGGKIKMEPIWDYNLSMGNANYNSGQDPTGWYYQQAGLGMTEYAYFPRLFQDPDFAQRYSDRWQELRRTEFETSQMMADIDAAVSILTDGTNIFPSGTNPQQPSVNPLVRNFKRWQILGQHVWPNAVAYSNWADELTYLKNFLIQRWNWIDNQYLGVPQTNRSGGKITGPTFFTMTPPGGAQVYYTTDGSDPRLSGGAISPKAVLYTGPMTIDATTRIRARSYQIGRWSDDIDHSFVKDAGLRVTELMYHPPNPPDGSSKEDNAFEFIELYNAGTEPIDLSGYNFDVGITYTFPAGTILEPGTYRVLVSDAVAFAERYPGVEVHGMYAGRLDDTGERVRLLNAAGAAILDFTYDDGGSWPGRADGDGSSLETVEIDGDLSNPASWRSSTVFAGTPGGRPALQNPGVVINEVLARTTAPEVDAIELYNPTGEAIDLSGWYLSDSRTNFRKFLIPAGTIIPAGGYLVFDEHDFNPTPENPAPHHFALDGSRGDDVWLVQTDAEGRLHTFVDGVSFHGGAAEEGASIGRTRDGTGRLRPLLAPTLGGPNRPPTVGKVLISEVMYNHPSLKGVHEFIELHNASASPVSIGGWRLAGGVDYVFPAGTTIPAFGELIVVPFDPLDPRQAPLLDQFRTAYGLSSSVLLAGGFGGRLDNAGDNVRLERPDVPMPGEPGQFVFLVVDDVGYEPDGAWPNLPDGGGASLARANPQGNGHSAGGWSAPDPTPGSHAFGPFAIVGSDADDVYHVRLSEDGMYVEVMYGTRFVTPSLAYTYERAGANSLSIDGGAGQDQFVVDLSAASLSLPIEVSFGDAGGSDSISVTGLAAVTIGEDRSLTDLVVGDGARVTVVDGVTVRTDGVSVGGAGARLDLGTARLLVRKRAGTLVAVENLVASGRNGGQEHWTGSGITSSAAAADPLMTLAVVSLDEDVLVRFTYNGDMDGNGRINADDYFRIDSGFLAQPPNPFFAQGDLNYDNKVNADDYFLIDSAFLGQGAPLAGATPTRTATATTTQDAGAVSSSPSLSSSSSSSVTSAPGAFSTTTIATNGRKATARPILDTDRDVLSRSTRRPAQRATGRTRS